MKRPMFVALTVLALAARLQAEMPREPKVQLTISNIRTIAKAIDAYAVDHGAYPVVEHYTELWSLLSPKYLAGSAPLADGWGNPFVYRVSGDGCHFRIVSGGGDGAFAKPSLMISKEPPKDRTFTDTRGDIIFQDESFRTLPLGANDAFDVKEQANFICKKNPSH